VAAAAQRVEGKDDSRRARVEVEDRRLAVGEIALVRLPQPVGIERLVRTRDDRANGFADALCVPRLLRQRFEVGGVKERQRALARSQICVQKGASTR
jgi:hypothetical protein